MYAQVEKPKENKSRAVANSVAQNKNDVKQCFGFVDNRSETIAQRKLQRMVDSNTTRQNPSIVQRCVAPQAIIQRVAKEKLKPVSEHLDYMLSTENSNTLYSDPLSPEPSPKGLYLKANETVTGDENEYSVNKWTPRVKFFSKEEQLGFEKAHEENIRDNADHPNGLAGLWSRFLGRSDREVGTDEINNAWYKMIQNKQFSIEESMKEGASLGILGNNDCALFARTLHHLIKVEKEDEERSRDVEDLGEVTKGERADDEPVTGTFIQHVFPEKVGGCGYHGVTVVAKDGSTLITLEAHASKTKLLAPEFHMRNGIEGFVKDNTPDGLSDESKLKWQTTVINVKHPDKPSSLLLGSSPEEDIANYTDLDDRGSQSRAGIGIHMSKMGVTKRD